MQKAATLGRAIQLGRLLFEAADAQHLPQQVLCMHTVNM
jgi:hypothetical protein